MRQRKITRKIKREVLRISGYKRVDEEDPSKIWVKKIDSDEDPTPYTRAEFNDFVYEKLQELMNDDLLAEYLEGI